MSRDVIAFAGRALDGGQAVALAILTESGRDTPGVPGGMMAVCGDGSQAGTIGGGTVEAQVAARCRSALEDPAVRTFPFDYSLRRDGGLDMLCGGEMKGIVTILRPAGRLLIFGGGHVGQKLYEAGLTAGFEVVVVEDREDLAEGFPRARFVLTDDWGSAAGELAGTGEPYVVIVTRGHVQDRSVLTAVLETGARYIGMIGSRKKVGSLFAGLREQGVPQAALDRVYTPIGLDVDDGSPGEIAIGILAEILAVKNGGTLRHRRDRPASER